MAVNSIIRRTASFLGIGPNETPKTPQLDGDIIYCKNNVCVHPPSPLRVETDHHPGYLMIRSQTDEVLGCTLILTWIPNSTLKKNPRSIENKTPLSSPCRSTRSSACPSPHHSPRHSVLSFYSELRSNGTSPRMSICSERSADDLAQAFLASIQNNQDRKDTHSISSTASEMGSPRDDVQSLDSWSQSDGGSCSNRSLATKATTSLPSQPDSGIGPEEVSAALECMISGLNDIGGQNNGQRYSETNSLNVSDRERIFNNKNAMDEVCRFSSQGELSQSKDTCQSPLLDRDYNVEMEGDTLRVVAQEDDAKGDTGDDENTFDSDGSLPTDYAIDNGEGVGSDDSLSCRLSKRALDLTLRDDDDSDTIREDLTVTSHPIVRKSEKRNLKLQLEKNGSTSHTSVPEVVVGKKRSRCRSDGSTTSTTSDHNQLSFSSTPSELGSPVPELQEHSSSHPCSYYLQETPETWAMTHNLAFPESAPQSCAPSPTRREHQCSIFSVDLGQMRSLRMFFNNRECTCGQLVIASRESQYKILHFHYGGFDKLASVFEEWNVLIKPKNRNDNCPYRQFSVCRPEVTQDECHPEDGVYNVVDEEMWHTFMNEDGQVEDDYHLRKAIFFGGLDPSFRREAWPFLLQCYSFLSSHEEREQVHNQRYLEYQAIRKQRENMKEEELEIFWRNIQCTVEKDVIRTDRSNPFFAGDNNPNVEIMKNILLNYAVYNPHMGYTQGMSDLLAPVLVEIQNEVDAFWCFVGLMQRTIFVCSPKDSDMDKNLSYLRELIHLTVPRFYNHLKEKEDGLELLFTHRWILLCFKREFPEADALRMWEACWANYQTDYFHLFLCVAIIAIYGDDVIQQDLPSDEMLLHFTSLAMHMNGELVLRKARGLLHQYRQLERIPCSLHGLCEICGPGMWDSGHVPAITCTVDHGDQSCPHGGQEPTHSGGLLVASPEKANTKLSLN